QIGILVKSRESDLSIYILSFYSLDTPDGVCSLKPERGPCSINAPRHYWDKELGDCKEFVYSGCAGNGNNFPDQETCRKYCK
ncbi:serine protease inhibitor, putative, partial [Ixodes scapularis]